MPACGSPWLFAAYHVFLRRPVPWHPPCALSNLIVTKLSSCQRIVFTIFNFYFLLRPTAKLFAFLRYALIYIIASQLVSLQDVFHLAVQFSKYIQVFACRRSLKTIQVQEEEQSILCSIDRNLFAFSAFCFLSTCSCSQQIPLLAFAFIRLYRPGVKLCIPASLAP